MQKNSKEEIIILNSESDSEDFDDEESDVLFCSSESVKESSNNRMSIDKRLSANNRMSKDNRLSTNNRLSSNNRLSGNNRYSSNNSFNNRSLNNRSSLNKSTNNRLSTKFIRKDSDASFTRIENLVGSFINSFSEEISTDETLQKDNNFSDETSQKDDTCSDENSNDNSTDSNNSNPLYQENIKKIKNNTPIADLIKNTTFKAEDNFNSLIEIEKLENELKKNNLINKINKKSNVNSVPVDISECSGINEGSVINISDSSRKHKYQIIFTSGKIEKKFYMNEGDSIGLLYYAIFGKSFDTNLSDQNSFYQRSDKNLDDKKLFYEDFKLNIILTAEESGFFEGVNYVTTDEEIKMEITVILNFSENESMSCEFQVDSTIKEMLSFKASKYLKDKDFYCIRNGSIIGNDCIVGDVLEDGDVLDLVLPEKISISFPMQKKLGFL